MPAELLRSLLLAATVWRYLVTQCEAVVVYLRLMFWPYPLAMDYGSYRVIALAEVLPQALLLITLLGATVWAWFRRPMAGFLGSIFLSGARPVFERRPAIFAAHGGASSLSSA